MGRRICALLVAVVALAASAGPAAGAEGGAGDVGGTSVITYSVRGKGNVSDLEQFAASAAATYADPRGWSLGGSIRFERVDAGGDFTLWLAADALMSTFGGACDVIWSCRNGRNVVINEDRWLGATDAVLGGGGTPADYRRMVVNHETGHWLGFGHATCSGPGRPAPVMQQQSMDLQGCTFNPWPLPGERTIVAARRHVPIVQAGETAEPEAAAPATPTPSTTRPAPPLRRTCHARVGGAALRPWIRCF